MNTLKYITDKTVQQLHYDDTNDAEYIKILNIYINIVLHKFILASNSLIKHIQHPYAPNLYVNRITNDMYYIAAIYYSSHCIDTASAADHTSKYNLLCHMYPTAHIQMIYVDATNIDTSYICIRDDYELKHATFCGLNELFDIFNINFKFNQTTYESFISAIQTQLKSPMSPKNEYYYSPASSPVVDGYPFTPMVQHIYVTPPKCTTTTPQAPKKQPLNINYTAYEIEPLILTGDIYDKV